MEEDMKNNTYTSTDYLEHQLGNPKCSKLTPEEKQRRLNKQFVDASYGMNQAEYNKWLKDVKKTYIHTIETESLLMGDLHCYRNNYRDDLCSKAIGNLSPLQIVKILDSIDLYTIMKLIASDLEITSIAEFYPVAIGNCVFSDGTSQYLYAELNNIFNRSWSKRNYIGKNGEWYRDGIKSISGINACITPKTAAIKMDFFLFKSKYVNPHVMLTAKASILRATPIKNILNIGPP